MVTVEGEMIKRVPGQRLLVVREGRHRRSASTASAAASRSRCTRKASTIRTTGKVVKTESGELQIARHRRGIALIGSADLEPASERGE